MLTLQRYKKYWLLLALFVLNTEWTMAANILVECESFNNRGGWSIDQQFMDQMGSPYLLAHGMGTPVADATTEINLTEHGIYHVYVRTYNWTAPWTTRRGPGQFAISVSGHSLKTILGDTGQAWQWQYAGHIKLKAGRHSLTLHDLTGFDARADAIYLTTDATDVPPSAAEELAAFRQSKTEVHVSEHYDFDFVVVGGGVAGISAAVSAARLGCRVALIHDRPVLGGNNSSEVRVHLGGRIGVGLYPHLGDLMKEFGPTHGGNAQKAEVYGDDKKLRIIAAEPNIHLFANYHVCKASVMDSHPEIDSSPLFNGIDMGGYPHSRTWIVGVQLDF